LKKNNQKILIRGAGELASGVALTLHRVGFKVIMTELEIPLSIRRTVSFSEAMVRNLWNIEDVLSVYSSIANVEDIINDNKIPVLIDLVELLDIIKPDFYVDARMLKSEVVDRRNKNYFTIGLGPGFTVNKNCDAIIETKRGHDLGKVIWNGTAQQNTGIPGNIGGKSKERVIHSSVDGRLEWFVEFGNLVEMNQVLGRIQNIEIKSKINGLVRGLISPKVAIKKGMKIADIDPRGNAVDYKTISDKARNIGRGVLEAILIYSNR
jgi:xanthine dehydrogenase accessory factor